MSIFDEWFTERCSVRTIVSYDESGAQVVEDHAQVPCLVEDGNQLVRDQAGQETVSSTRLYLPAERAAWFKHNSAVTVRGTTSEVIDVIVNPVDLDADLNAVTVVLK